MALNGRALLREDNPLKLLLMSATLDGERLARMLGDAPLLRSEGRMFPVELRWGQPWPAGAASSREAETRVLQTVLRALEDETGSVLVFLPGQAEIRRLADQLGEALAGRPEILVCPLHGELELSAQRAAIEKPPAGQRKVVLATNIAETSLTIDGVRVVVDAGLARVPRFDPGTGMTRLDTQRISRASAAQRAGRAGRLEPGVCYRLWSQAKHEQLPAFASAEILQADLCGLALQLARWGVEPGELSWLDAPPAAAFAQSRELLQRLGALRRQGSGWELTAHGRAMAELPVHPRIAHLLLRGQQLGLGELACQVAALLGERDIQRGGGADLHERLMLLQAPRGSGAVQRVRQLARQLRAYLRGGAEAPVSDPQHPRWLGALLAFAYPDRIARQRREGGGDYRLANGRAAQFAEPDALMKHPWLVIADLGSRQGQREERIYLAAALEPELFDGVLAEQLSEHEEIDWDAREGALRAERQWRVGELLLRREALPTPDPQQRARALLGLVRRKGLELLPWTPELRQWQARVALLRGLDLQRDGNSDWPDLSDAALLDRLEDWLLPGLGRVTRLSHFAELDLASLLAGLLPWPLPRRLEELAPKALAVRLQELFGLAATPRIADGRLALKLHLLSPGRRPVQVTQDLASFWQNTYAEVKKDLTGRYPKHYWPDDPLQAEPTARANPRR